MFLLGGAKRAVLPTKQKRNSPLSSLPAPPRLVSDPSCKGVKRYHHSSHLPRTFRLSAHRAPDNNLLTQLFLRRELIMTYAAHPGNLQKHVSRIRSAVPPDTYSSVCVCNSVTSRPTHSPKKFCSRQLRRLNQENAENIRNHNNSKTPALVQNPTKTAGPKGQLEGYWLALLQ